MTTSTALQDQGVAARGATATGSAASGPWLTCAPLRNAKHASCCPARPAVEASVPRLGGCEHLLLCGDHFQQRRQSLLSAGAVVFDTDGRLLMPRAWDAD